MKSSFRRQKKYVKCVLMELDNPTQTNNYKRLHHQPMKRWNTLMKVTRKWWLA